MPETDRHAEQLYQLRAVLRGISPLIWRRLLVRSDSTVAQLHEVLQIAFGWDDEHLNRLEIRGREYAVYRDGGGMHDRHRFHDCRSEFKHSMTTYTGPSNTGIQISGTGMRRSLLHSIPPVSGCSPCGLPQERQRKRGGRARDPERRVGVAPLTRRGRARTGRPNSPAHRRSDGARGEGAGEGVNSAHERRNLAESQGLRHSRFGVH
jgi:hypothetical protein